MKRSRIVQPLRNSSGRRRLRLSLAAIPLLLRAAAAGAAEKIPVFPDVPYDRFVIYEDLILFWIAIIGLLVILRLKIREAERIQALGVDREDPDAPLLQ